MYSFAVSELSLPGAQVGRLSALDPDVGENAALEYSILDGDGGGAFNLTTQEEEGVLTLNQVGRLSALDPDVGENAALEYSILDGDGGGAFNLTTQEEEGVLTLNQPVFLACCRHVLLCCLGALPPRSSGGASQRSGPRCRGERSAGIFHPRRRRGGRLQPHHTGGGGGPHPEPDNTASLLLLSPFPSRPHLSPVFVPVVVWDSGQPPLSSTGTVTVSVCECGQGMDSVHPGLSSCRPLQLASPATGLSTGALLAILACIATLLGHGQCPAGQCPSGSELLSPPPARLSSDGTQHWGLARYTGLHRNATG
ncbi:UNVERIFIED_CONTAM: hypothetical protein FKN15_022502 [Acipenser sinensis]